MKRNEGAFCWFVASAVVLLSFAPARSDSVLSPEDTKFLHDQAMRVVAAARVAPGEKSGGATNTTPYVMHLPDSHQAYTAFWVRDSNMALGADFVSVHDVQDWIKLTASTLSKQDWQVQPGVLVPAWSVPDHINFDGKATYYPGNYEEGGKQGGGFGDKLPPLDDAFFFLFTVSEQVAMSHNLDFFNAPVVTKDGDSVRLSDLCLKAYDAIPVDAASGIPVTGDVEQPNAHGKDFGFCDAVEKSGKLMFTAVLRYDAARRMAPIYRRAGQPAVADRLVKDAARIKQNLAPTFYHESSTPGEGWLNSATKVGNQPDVWGSAYAVAVGAVDAKTSPKVARALLRGFHDSSTVISGNASEVLTHDPKFPNGWERSLVPMGVYQNGAYWATPSGWYIMALHTIDPAAARAMAKDYVDFMRANRLQDGTSQAWEWFNPGTNTYTHPQYVASAAFAYGTLKRAGLIP